MAKWANDPAQKTLWDAKPVRGEVGILVVPETQEWDYLLNYDRKEKPYPEAMWGAYRAFLGQGLQPDWVHIDDIDAYDFLYFPYPIMFTAEQATRLKSWVEKGGTLISEACPGYFGDRGHVGQVQPNMGLDEVFGAREEEVEFMPDIGDRIHFKFDDMAVDGGGLLQSYRLTDGIGRGAFDGGRLAVVENRFGKGRTLLIGTNPSVAFYRTNGKANAAFFAELVKWSGRTRHGRRQAAAPDRSATTASSQRSPAPARKASAQRTTATSKAARRTTTPASCCADGSWSCRHYQSSPFAALISLPCRSKPGLR